jgi:S1-C subfamily serine protease
MRCPRCGTWLRPGVTRCGPCGADVTDGSAAATGGIHNTVDDAPPWMSGWTTPPPDRRESRQRRVLAAAGAVGLVALGATGATWLREDPDRRPVAAHEQSHVASSQVAASAGDFADVYETVHGGVAQVLVETCDDGDYTGTAFLVGPRLMMTAQHVVEGASRVQVDFDGELIDADIDGVDLPSDLALLRLDHPVDGHVFQFVAADAVPGTRVAAIGYPLDEPKTLTEGTISGLDREIDTESGSFDGMVQTDTAINPGNSGGPLVDVNGAVVGVADAIRKNAQGIGFAVPASAADDMLTEPLDPQELETCS